MKQLAKAVLAVMEDVKGIDKTLNVGSGAMSYKGVPDQEVKKIIGTAMKKHGLVMLPIGINSNIEVNNWDEEAWDNYQKKNVIKRKQSVFTSVETKYLLLHESGESMEIVGYGHGVDSQDKSAGKATTYALKYALLYTFMVPTGKIDDTDLVHSNDIELPKKSVESKPEQPSQPIVQKAKITDKRFANALREIELGNYTSTALRATFELTPTQDEMLIVVENAQKERGQ